MRFDAAALLIQRGANPNHIDFWGRAPLYATVDLNTIPRGGRPDRPVLDRTTALQVVERLLEAGANPNAQLKLSPPFRNVGNDRGLDGILTTGTTPLLRAAKALDAPAIRVLLAKGADLSIANSRGITPLMAAAGLGSVDADTRGFYLSEDTQQRSIESLKLLLKAGGDINAKDSRGLSPLHEAAAGVGTTSSSSWWRTAPTSTPRTTAATRPSTQPLARLAATVAAASASTSIRTPRPCSRNSRQNDRDARRRRTGDHRSGTRGTRPLGPRRSVRLPRDLCPGRRLFRSILETASGWP
jgi:hypothetical protein